MGYQQNALDNNVDIKMNTKVEKIEYSNNEWQINTSNRQGSFIAISCWLCAKHIQGVRLPNGHLVRTPHGAVWRR